MEQLEVRYVLDGEAILADDAFDVHQNGPQLELDVLANDVFGDEYAGQRLITSVSYGSEGGRIEIAGDRQGIRYMPPADFFGIETFVYAVDGQHTANVQVNIAAPLAFDHFNVPPDGLEHPLDVLANDPFWPGYAGPRQITGVSVGSAGGTIAIAADRASIRYTPPDGAFGKETFIYVVDDVYPAQVTIEIPETLKSDQFELVQHAPATVLNVLANDPFWPGYGGARQITHVTASQTGATIEIAADGRSIIYTPGDVASGWDWFQYVVDGAYEADVSVVLHRPVRDDGFEVDENSTGFYYNVTINDTYYDLSNHLHDVIDRVTSVTQPDSGGTVTISADGQEIVYTPPAGFHGSDTFAYVADGVHEATVRAQVTRPVRDDYISSGVYQDTPNVVLNVLGNDFVGNGYAGPRLITAVGATEHGGSVTIRSDGKALQYTPAAGYTGQESFTYTVDGLLEANATVYVRPLAQPDSVTFCPDPNHAPYAIDVLANDHFDQGYPGPGVITAVELVSGSGQVSSPGGQIVLFDPDEAGSHLIRYTVDGQYEATVSVWIRSHADPDQIVVDQNSSATEIDVLANDFDPDPYYVDCKAQDYPGPRLITGVTQSQHGGVVSVAADGRSVHYQPPADFHGQDSFTYTVDDFMTGTVTVEVIRRVRDDQFRVDAADGPQTLPVLVNDLLGANYSGPGQITAVTATASGGTATIAADAHSIVYTPPAGFFGADTFTYTVDGALKAEVRVVVDAPASDQFPTFGSLEDYTQFLIDDALVRYAYLFGQIAWPYFLGPGPVAEDGAGDPRNHSETNVQVAGVDEGDIVEFDSDYVYMLTDDELVIVDAWPAEDLSVASRFTVEGQPLVEFLHGDRLTIISEIGGGYLYPPWDYTDGPIGDGFWPPVLLPSSTIVTVLDVSDRTAPSVVQMTTMEGKYVDSRGVGDFVYVLVSNADAIAPEPLIIDEDGDPNTFGRYETREEYLARVTANPGELVEAALPNYTSYGPDGEMVRTGLLNEPEGIFRPLVPDATNLISVVSFNIEGDEPGLADTSAVYSTGASAIYASLDNFYVFDKDYAAEDGAVTRIVKFDWEPETGGVEFAATTTVAGTILNQFSADENGPYLRIATTVSNDYSGNWSGRDENMLFVMQEDYGVFEFVGSLQNLALDETMRSVRFLGDRAFVTTFRNVDPLFAIDLTDPARPESVGHVTLPGYTSYMHLIDENHLLTVGRNTPIGYSGPTQVAIFDIADLAQPLRIAEYTFERFTTSEAELDHHAFGYFAEHGLLGMPVAREYVVRVDEDGDGYREARRTVREDELAVFSVDASAADPGQRLVLAGQITHGTPVRRSGYIGDKLYSIANDSVKVVDVSDPGMVIAALVVEEPDGTGNILPSLDPTNFGTNAVTATENFPASRTDEGLIAAVDRAREDLARRLQCETGAPMLVTAEAAPAAPGGGYYLVFRVGDQQYLYRAGDNGMVQLVNGAYEFTAAAGAWHAVEAAVVAPPTGLRGDYNLDGRVDQQDHGVWSASFGAWSLTEYLSADGNRDGTVDTADYVVWRANLGAVAGDFDGNGVVDDADHGVWGATFGSPTDMRADANGDGHVDAADYVVWRDRADLAESTSGSSLDVAEAVSAQEGGLTSLAALNNLGTIAAQRPTLRVRARDHVIRDDVVRQFTIGFRASDNGSLLALDVLAADRGEESVRSFPVARSVAGSRTQFDSRDQAFESLASGIARFDLT